MKFWQSKNNPQCKLSQQDLLDISEEINQQYTPFDNHHQPELVLMPVDPINLYAYWNLKENKTNTEISPVDKQLALRIYSIPELSEHPGKLQLSFDIKVYGFRNQQKVQLPIAATAYSAVVGEINADDSFSPLAISDTIHVPRETPVDDISMTGNETILDKDNEQVNNFIRAGESQDSSTFADNLLETLKALSADSKININVTSEMNNLEMQQFKVFILKNFNDYGYDLKVYTSELVPDFNNMMLKKNIKTHLSHIKTKVTDKNISGLGRLL